MKAEGAEVVHAEDVVGVAVGVEDGVEAVDAGGNGLGVEVGAGVDDDVVALPGDEDGGAGAAVVRRRRGYAGRGRDGGGQTAQSHPSVGTPIEVPLPRKVRVACIGL